MKKHAERFCVILAVGSFLLYACAAPSLITVSDVVVALPTEPGSQAESLSSETIKQNNCGGSADVTTVVTRERTIVRTLDLGTELSVSADGQVGLLGTQVELGTAIAEKLGYSYGASERVSRALTIRALAGTNMEHTIGLQEIWTVGDAMVTVSGQSITLPFRFRTDFAVDLVQSVDLGCAGAFSTASSPAQLATPTPLTTPSADGPTPTPSPASVDQQEPILSILDQDFSPNTYLIVGSQASHHELGDALVVYGELSPGVEVAIALLRVVKYNPDSISAQAILVHPNRAIRPSLRVDNRLEHLVESELIPAADFAVGYLLAAGQVFLRPNGGVNEGDILEALDPVVSGSMIVDYLPFTPPRKMRVVAVGSTGRVVQVDLMEGEWPEEGTILRLLR